MLADAGAPAVLAGVPHAVMLADAGAPAVLASAPLAVMLADAGFPHSLQLLLMRLCSQMLAPPQSVTGVPYDSPTNERKELSRLCQHPCTLPPSLKNTF